MSKSEKQWPIGNMSKQCVSDMHVGDLKLGVQVMRSIKTAVARSYKHNRGPLSLLLGMDPIVGCTTKVHYILNRPRFSYFTMLLMA